MDRHIYSANISKIDDTISRYFSLPGHKKPNNMKIHILDFINAHPESGKGAFVRNTIKINWMY